MSLVEKKQGTSMTGPIRSRRQVGGVSVLGRQRSVTVTALAANAAEVYTISDSQAEVGDVVLVSPNTAPEAGWGLEAAWVSAAGTISVRARNHSASALTGGALVLNYALTR
jgi:hypothetical protein